MKIIGANLGEKDVEYKDLREWTFFSDDLYKQQILKGLSVFYKIIKEQSKSFPVSAFPQENGKVKIVSGMINHKCSNSLSSLITISKYGVLASEWFGVIESEHEGAFCTFVDRIHNENDPIGKRLNMQRLMSISKEIILFFDSSHPIMQKLLRLDYFEFEKVKQLKPEKLNELYTKDEIQLFQQIIEPLSQAGKSYHSGKSLPYCDWSAIPGGIPTELINGICTKTLQYSEEYINELKKLFPNATIFNSKLEVIYTPKQEIKTELQQIEDEFSTLEEEKGKKI